MNPETKTQNTTDPKGMSFGQFGGALLPVVAVAGVIMVMTQGTIFYKAKASSHFLTDERNKIMAAQAAEAGVENTIADIGARRLVVNASMHNYTNASNAPIGSGTFTTTLSTLGMGPDGDTVDLQSRGVVAGKDKDVLAKLRLHNAFDTNQVILSISKPDTTLSTALVTVTDTTYTETFKDPFSMPQLDSTPAYTACMASAGPKCQICHLTSSDVHQTSVIDVAKPAIWKHITHHGDYVTTDGTCDIYNPILTPNYTTSTRVETTLVITDHITYDTTMAIDTLVKVEVLSWR